MDETQARGMSAEHVAQRILNAIACRENEVLVAPLVHRIAVYLRNILPDLYFRIMLARANKQHKENSKKQWTQLKIIYLSRHFLCNNLLQDVKKTVFLQPLFYVYKIEMCQLNIMLFRNISGSIFHNKQLNTDNTHCDCDWWTSRTVRVIAENRTSIWLFYLF